MRGFFLKKYILFQRLIKINVPTSLFFNHNLGGGANDYLLSKKQKLRAQNEKCIELIYDVYSGKYKLQVNYKGNTVSLQYRILKSVIHKVEQLNINTIYINELVSFPDIYSVLRTIVRLKNISKAKLVMLEHDYYSVCPTINLLKRDCNYCGLNCEIDKKCLVKNQYVYNSRYKDIDQWRNEWKVFLAECDSIIVFSNDSKNILEKAYGTLDNIVVNPHVTNKMLEVEKKYKITNKINIGILGVLSDRKGLKLVKEMLKLIHKEKLSVNIIVLGVCEENIADENFYTTGKYTREQLPSMMYLYDIDVIFIASVWPETFSYTTDEAIKMHMSIAAFRLGAPAERIAKYDRGLLIEFVEPKYALKKIIEFVEKKKYITRKIIKVLFVIEYESFSSRYRVNHLREHLAYIGIASDLVFINNIDVQNINKYNAVFIYRCTNVKKIQDISNITKQMGLKLLYDIDDFIFDYDQIKYLDFLKTKEYKNFNEYSLKIRKSMELSDIITTSTNTLAEEIKNRFPKKVVVVCRNVACFEMQLLSEIAIEENPKQGSNRVVLGYFSGSHTHNNDWRMIENVIRDVMNNNSQVDLMLVGALEIGSVLAEYKHRITRIPFVDWQKLPELLRYVDINLMPLENELFHWCKSENKWMEAGLVGIPTVASRNLELERIMTDRENVLFCDSESDWKDNITKLVNNEQFRHMVGSNAKIEVYNTHLITSEVNFKKILDVLLID